MCLFADTGVRNWWHGGDIVTTVLLTASSADSAFSSVIRNVSVTNMDIYWPRDMSAYPLAMRPQGQSANLSGGMLFFLMCVCRIECMCMRA